MQLVAYRNTMSGAKFKAVSQDEVVRRTVEQVRAERRAQARAEATEKQNLELLRRQREQANEAIRNANAALRTLHGIDICVSRIIKRICRATRVTPDQLVADSRASHVVFARQAVCYWARRCSGLSYPRIGIEMGNRDHTTVMHGAKAYREKRLRMGRTLREAR